MSSEKTLNEVFSALSTRRRYEVWFVRLHLADGSGAWWFRYLLLNPGRPPHADVPQRMPVQVWATWFPLNARPTTIIQGFSLLDLDLSPRHRSPFHLLCGSNEITENGCRASLENAGHKVSWQLQYRSTFRVTLSDKGWIGFSRTPHSDATFSGCITLDGRTIEGSTVGYGLQGHNCGYRHRGFWVWGHAFFCRGDAATSTLEALVYDMPMRMVFRKAVLWHNGRSQVFRNFKESLRDRENLCWEFAAIGSEGSRLEFFADARGPGIHRLSYEKTSHAGSFDVLNNSLSHARIRLWHANGKREELETANGAVLEMAGNANPIP